jgi:hypothetical protein
MAVAIVARRDDHLRGCRVNGRLAEDWKMTNSVRKINAFAIDPRERYAFAGNLNGELLKIDLDTFSIVEELRVSVGDIEGIDVHPELPYVAALSGDKTLAICKYDENHIEIVHSLRLRDTVAENAVRLPEAHKPLSQAIAFHPHERRLLTRSPGSATEVAFDDTKCEVLWCHEYFVDSTGSAVDLAYIRYLPGGLIFCSSGAGLVVVDPARRDEPLLRWVYDDQTIHCAEHIEGDEYLLASDSRRVFRFDVSGKKPPKIGPFIARDHVERLSYNPVSGRAYVSSFDRNVREFDPNTLESKGVVVETPFKLRWLYSLRRAPSVMVIQCRNGALFKVDLNTKEVLGVIKETPNALWSAASPDPSRVYVAGEGAEVLEISAAGEDKMARQTHLEAQWLTFAGDPGRFTKRMIAHPQTGALLLGRSDGDVVVATSRNSKVLTNLGAAVRDLAAPPEGLEFYAVCEDGRAHRVELETGRVLASCTTPNDEPFWALAYNHARRLLAVIERHGELHLLDAETMTIRKSIPGAANTKRMRWVDDDRLLLNLKSSVFELNVNLGTFENVIPQRVNTVEDFGWSEDRRFFVLVHYHCQVELFDFKTFAQLDTRAIDMDLPHGMHWLSPRRTGQAYPYEFLVFGRSGVVHRYRVHNDLIIGMDPANREMSKPISDKGLRVV